MKNNKSLVRRVYEVLGPTIKVNHEAREIKFLDEGMLFSHLTRTYYVFIGYKVLEKD